MILDRAHRQWRLLTMVVLVIGSVAYATYASGPSGVSGGSLPGLVFGLVGTAMMVFAGLLSARRQVPTWRIGSAQFWLKGHIWIGLLSVAFTTGLARWNVLAVPPTRRSTLTRGRVW